MVIASSPQLLVGLSGWWLARCKRSRFIFEVRDLWPESLAAVGAGSTESLVYRALTRIAGFLYRRSDHIVVVTPAFKEYLVRHWQVAAEKISVVENGVEAEVFSPRSESSLRTELGADGKFVVSYIGTMGNAHGLQTLVEAAAQLQNSAPRVLFLLVGEGAEKEQLVALARSRGLTNLRFVDQQSREKIPAYICASDACLVLLKKDEIFKTVIPSKMLEFMSCGRAVILGVEGQARKILEEAQAGICIEPGNSGELAQAVLRLADDQPLRETLGRNGRRHVLQHFSRRQTALAYLEVLSALVRRRQAVAHRGLNRRRRLSDGHDGCGGDCGLGRTSYDHFTDAAGNKQDVVRLHGNVSRLGLQHLFQLNGCFRHSIRPLAENLGRIQLGQFGGPACQRDRLQNRQTVAVHQESAGPAHFAHHVNDVGLVDEYGVARSDRNVAGRIIGQLPAQGYGHGLVGLVAVSHGYALARRGGETAGGGNDVKQSRLANHRIDARFRSPRPAGLHLGKRTHRRSRSRVDSLRTRRPKAAFRSRPELLRR